MISWVRIWFLKPVCVPVCWQTARFRPCCFFFFYWAVFSLVWLTFFCFTWGQELLHTLPVFFILSRCYAWLDVYKQCEKVYTQFSFSHNNQCFMLQFMAKIAMQWAKECESPPTHITWFTRLPSSKILKLLCFSLGAEPGVGWVSWAFPASWCAICTLIHSKLHFSWLLSDTLSLCLESKHSVLQLTRDENECLKIIYM